MSMSLGHTVLFKLRRRATGNSPSEIRLDHCGLVVMDTSSELSGSWGLTLRSDGYLSTISLAQ